MVYDATTLTFRPGCIQHVVTRREARQRRFLSSDGSVRIREVASQKDDIFQVRLQQLHRADEGSFSGWDSLRTFLTATSDFARNTITFTDADGDVHLLRLWSPAIRVREVKQDVFEGVLVFRKSGAGSLTLIASDSFTEGSNTNLTDHSPDTGGFSWQHNGSAGDIYVESAVGRARFTQNSGNWARSSIDLIPTSYVFASQCEVHRNGVDGGQEQAGLYGYAETTNPVVGKGFALNVIRASANSGEVKFYETNDSSVNIQDVSLQTGVDWDLNELILLRYEVDGLSVSPFWKKDEGDEWTALAVQTLTQDMRDGDHRAAGMFGNDGTQLSSSEPYVDNWKFYA